MSIPNFSLNEKEFPTKLHMSKRLKAHTFTALKKINRDYSKDNWPKIICHESM